MSSASDPHPDPPPGAHRDAWRAEGSPVCARPDCGAWLQRTPVAVIPGQATLLGNVPIWRHGQAILDSRCGRRPRPLEDRLPDRGPVVG